MTETPEHVVSGGLAGEFEGSVPCGTDDHVRYRSRGMVQEARRAAAVLAAVTLYLEAEARTDAVNRSSRWTRAGRLAAVAPLEDVPRWHGRS